jgi:hypothetical protein
MVKTVIVFAVMLFFAACPAQKAFEFELSDLPEETLEWADAKVSEALQEKRAQQKKRGTISKADALEVLRTQRHGIERCVQKHLPTDPSAAVKLRWKLLPTGRISDVKIIQKRASKSRLETCLAKALANGDWPAFDGKAKTITLPIQVDPGD